MIKYKYQETERIRNLIIEIEALKIVFGSQRILPQIEQNLRRESLLRSAVFSARVEGNPVTIDRIDDVEYLHKLEVNNLLTTYNFINSNLAPRNLSVSFIKKIHKKVMKGLSVNAGYYRNEPWAIFNQAGVAVFLAPAHFSVPKLMDDLLIEIRNMKYKPQIKSAIFQFLFEKIHPFADGNGRVGRLISNFIMKIDGYGFRGLVSMEEAIDQKKELYYQALEPNINLTSFVEFYLEAFISQANKMLDQISNLSEPSREGLLTPRRKEIVLVIKDHPYCTFDFISRRFSRLNFKTLHYDVKKLCDMGYIVKIGKTRGSTYIAKEPQT